MSDKCIVNGTQHLYPLSINDSITNAYNAVLGRGGCRVKYTIHNTYKKFYDGEEVNEESKIKGYFLKFLKLEGVNTYSSGDKKQFNINEADYDKTQVFVLWNDPENCSDLDKFNECVVSSLIELEVFVNTPNQSKSKKSSPKPKATSKKHSNKNSYSYWFPEEENVIGKLIGFEGSNISELKENLKEALNLKFVRVDIFSKTSHGNNAFKLDVEENSDCNTCINLKVSYDGDRNFKVIKNIVNTYVHSTLYMNHNECSDENIESGDSDDEPNGW